MIIKLLKKSIAPLLIIFLLLAVPAVLASSPYQGLNDAVKDTGLAKKDSAVNLAGSLIKVVLSLLGVALVVVLIYAGIVWGFLSNGESAKIKKAKDMIINAVIGLVIVFAAYGITNFIVENLSKAATGSG